MEAVHIVLGAPKEENIAPLMHQEGIVIGVDRGALFAINEGIAVDIALGDFDSITPEEKEVLQIEAGDIFNFPTDKDDTDTEIALLYVLKNYPETDVYFYNWYGGRIDHLYSLLLVVLQKRFKPLIPYLHFISEKNHISFYLPGEHEIQKIEDMDYLSYILLTEVKDLTLQHVKYTLEKESFEQPHALISNEFLTDKASFSFRDGIIGVVQSTD